MAVDIGVGDDSSTTLDPGEPSLSLDYDGYYCFLRPLWERLRSETGQYIDLYGDASFAGEELAALGRALTEARRLVEAQPKAWSVHIGTQMSPEHRELCCQVQKVAMLALLDRLAAVVARARHLGRSVVCLGD
jgi:hypothetical protein